MLTAIQIPGLQELLDITHRFFVYLNMGISMLLGCIPLNFIYFRLCGVPQKKLGVAMLLSKMRIVSTTELPQECPILR